MILNLPEKVLVFSFELVEISMSVIIEMLMLSSWLVVMASWRMYQGNIIV